MGTITKKHVASDSKVNKFIERKDRSFHVRICKPTEIDKTLMEKTIKEAHGGIERVFFPRQKKPRFFFALCKEGESKEEVFKALSKFQCKEFGKIIPKQVKDKEFQQRVSGSYLTKKQDPLSLVLEAIPKELSTEDIKKEFSKCTNIHRFNDRRCYVYFETVKDAFEAFKKIRSEPTCGYKITAKYKKTSKQANPKLTSKKILMKGTAIPKSNDTRAQAIS